VGVKVRRIKLNSNCRKQSCGKQLKAGAKVIVVALSKSSGYILQFAWATFVECGGALRPESAAESCSITAIALGRLEGVWIAALGERR
jgi:hypothetical protein